MSSYKTNSKLTCPNRIWDYVPLYNIAPNICNVHKVLWTCFINLTRLTGFWLNSQFNVQQFAVEFYFYVIIKPSLICCFNYKPFCKILFYFFDKLLKTLQTEVIPQQSSNRMYNYGMSNCDCSFIWIQSVLDFISQTATTL